MKTVLITGCSTGFGREIAEHFLEAGWSVIATMRDSGASTLTVGERMRLLPLDVTDFVSIAAAVAEAGPIDVLVNNAGIGWLNAIEGTPMETAQEIFAVNVFGTIALMQAVLPGMRERGSGAIVNIGSSSTLKPLPLLSMYRASKAAVNALTESAALELAQFGIRACVVLPGMAPSTSFASSALQRISAAGNFPQPYQAYAETTLAAMQDAAHGDLTTAQDVAQVVYRAATDSASPLFLPAGPDAVAWFNGA